MLLRTILLTGFFLTLNSLKSQPPIKSVDTLAKLNPESILIVYREKIYSKDSKEFEILKKDSSLAVSSILLDQFSKSPIKCIVYYIKKEKK